MNETLEQRRKQFALTSGSGLLLLALALVLLNLLANWVFLRVDLTARHAYSLSDSSKKLVKNIDDRVLIKAYFTPDLPSPYNGFERYVRDLLTEYHAASHGHRSAAHTLRRAPRRCETSHRSRGRRNPRP